MSQIISTRAMYPIYGILHPRQSIVKCKFEALMLMCGRGHHGLDRMVVGFTATYAISAYHQ